jgi:hypothetical protein
MDFIKKLIGGILGFLTGLLPKKTSNGFYLELDEAASGSNPKVEAKPAASNGKTAEPVAAVAAPVDSPAPTAVAKAITNGKAPKAEPATPTVATPTETTFAPKYVAASVGSSNGRRRPGANMNNYLDLARQVKIPG